MAVRLILACVSLCLAAFVRAQSAPTLAPCANTVGANNTIKSNFVFQDGLSPALDSGLNKTLPYDGKKSNPWDDHNSIPSACLAAAQGKCDLDNMQVYDVVFFDSCATPWVFCRCTTAEMSQVDTRDSFGRIGSQLRSYVRHVMAFPKPQLAASVNQDLIYHGFVGNRTYVSGVIHQTVHAMDLGLGNFSTRSEWMNAVDEDDCVADETATFSYAEAFAQAMVVHISQILNNTITEDISCMSGQLSLLNTTFPYSKLFEPRCELDIKPVASQTVSKVTANNTSLSISGASSSKSASISTTAAPSSSSQAQGPQTGAGYRQAGTLGWVTVTITGSIMLGLSA